MFQIHPMLFANNKITPLESRSVVNKTNEYKQLHLKQSHR